MLHGIENFFCSNPPQLATPCPTSPPFHQQAADTLFARHDRKARGKAHKIEIRLIHEADG